MREARLLRFQGVRRAKEDTGRTGEGGGSLSRVHMIVSVSLGEISRCRERGARAFSIHPASHATSEKLDAPWPTFARSKDATEKGLAILVGAAREKVEREREGRGKGKEGGQRSDKIFHRGKTRAERKGRSYAPPRRAFEASRSNVP